jgi:hypothetical protein
VYQKFKTGEKMNYKKFLYYKKISYSDQETTYYMWFLVDKISRRGVHFHGRVTKIPGWTGNRFGFMAFGIECHSPVQVFDFDSRPVTEHCEVTQGKCWCDGTSLLAQDRPGWGWDHEVVGRLGHIDPNDALDEMAIWRVLENFYNSYFEEYENKEFEEGNN